MTDPGPGICPGGGWFGDPQTVKNRFFSPVSFPSVSCHPLLGGAINGVSQNLDLLILRWELRKQLLILGGILRKQQLILRLFSRYEFYKILTFAKCLPYSLLESFGIFSGRFTLNLPLILPFSCCLFFETQESRFWETLLQAPKPNLWSIQQGPFTVL